MLLSCPRPPRCRPVNWAWSRLPTHGKVWVDAISGGLPIGERPAASETSGLASGPERPTQTFVPRRGWQHAWDQSIDPGAAFGSERARWPVGRAADPSAGLGMGAWPSVLLSIDAQT
jgi:hypothetical protein